jgi:hypothetical protein
MHLSTLMRLADLGDGEMSAVDRKELIQAASAVKVLALSRSIPTEAAAREMARVCGLTGTAVERLRQEQDELMVTIEVGFRRCAPEVITLTDGSVHEVKHEKLGMIYERLSRLHGVKPRTLKDWCREWLS